MIDKNFKNKTGIYKITINDHIYIGNSINLYNRVMNHKSLLKQNKHSNQYLQRLYNKYNTV